MGKHDEQKKATKLLALLHTIVLSVITLPISTFAVEGIETAKAKGTIPGVIWCRDITGTNPEEGEETRNWIYMGRYDVTLKNVNYC
jgi:hypothetical protein